jgi:hypothetical protein
MKGYVTIRQNDARVQHALMLSTERTNKAYEFKLEQIQTRYNARHSLTRWLFTSDHEDAIIWAEIRRDDRLDKLDAIVYALRSGDVLITIDDFYLLDLGEIV